jgi:hypothetical protein
MPYPVATSSILPGNQSFIVVAAAGAASNAVRVDHMGGRWGNQARVSQYGASDSSYIREIANKFSMEFTCTAAEDVVDIETLLVLGNRMDIYVKRSSGATTYDKLADCVMTVQDKDVPESGDAHRTISLRWGGGTFTPDVASGTVPTLA